MTRRRRVSEREPDVKRNKTRLRAGTDQSEAKHQPGSVHGDFRFDSHKTGELSKRGLFDKTKW